LFNNTLQA